jgi:hypothetical protein
MTDFAPSTEPDWTRLCKGSDLKELRGEPYVLRETEDPDSPWRSMATRHEGMFRDPETRTPFYYMTIEFYGGAATATATVALSGSLSALGHFDIGDQYTYAAGGESRHDGEERACFRCGHCRTDGSVIRASTGRSCGKQVSDSHLLSARPSTPRAGDIPVLAERPPAAPTHRRLRRRPGRCDPTGKALAGFGFGQVFNLSAGCVWLDRLNARLGARRSSTGRH